jgi:predicted dinucleotide-binding enzyme
LPGGAKLYGADEEAREATEQLIPDAGYEPVSIGGIENARGREDFVPHVFAKKQLGRARCSPTRS